MIDLTRRFFLGSVLALSATGALANAPAQALRPPSRPKRVHPGLRLSLEEIVAEANLGGRLGFAVMDLATGQVLEAQALEEALPPASVAKAVTTVYALGGLPPEFRFRTTLRSAAPLQDGVLRGDLILEGTGDPLLGTDDLYSLFERAGVKAVEGGFKIYADHLPQIPQIDPTQLPQMGYNPSISGLNLNFNRFCLEWTRTAGEWRLSVDARSDTRRPPVNVARVRLAERAAPVYTYAREGEVDQWSVAVKALGQGGSRWLPVRDAAAYTGDVARSLAAEAGLPLPAAQKTAVQPAGTQILAEHQSPALPEILREMLRWSTNLTAETIGLSASIAKEGKPASLEASAAKLNADLLARYGVEVALVDHSGLKDQSRIAPRQMLKLLAAAKDTALRGLLRQHPLTDEAGETLKDPWLDVRAKTGTLDFVSTLAGYIRTSGGADLVFAIFAFEEEARGRAKASGEEIPSGARAWNGRARRLQQRLVQRWGALYPVPLDPL